MTRFGLRLMGMMLLGWLAVTLVALVVGNVLPPEGEILLTAVLADNDLDIYRMALLRHIIVPLTHNTIDDFQAAWSPDGEQIVFVSNRSGSNAIYTMDSQGYAVTRLTEGQIGDYNPNWSPDGRQIVFASDRYPTSRELLLYHLEDSTTRRLTDDKNLDNNPTWSPDSTHIVFSSVKNSNSQSKLYDVNLLSGEVTPLELTFDNYLSPSWSPDGRYILFHVMGGNSGLYVWDTVEARSIQLLSSLSFTGNMVDWSPDSRSIIYSTLTDNQYTGIFRMNIDAACIQQPDNCTPELLTTIVERYFNPRWRPTSP